MGCTGPYTLGPCLRKCLRMHAEWKRCLDRSFCRLSAYTGASVDGHVPGKWWKICLRDSAYAINIYIASARAYARVHQNQKWSMESCWWFCHSHFYKSLFEDVNSKGSPNADGCTPVAFWGLGFGKVKALWRKPRHQHLLLLHSFTLFEFWAKHWTQSRLPHAKWMWYYCIKCPRSGRCYSQIEESCWNNVADQFSNAFSLKLWRSHAKKSGTSTPIDDYKLISIHSGAASAYHVCMLQGRREKAVWQWSPLDSIQKQPSTEKSLNCRVW